MTEIVPEPSSPPAVRTAVVAGRTVHATSEEDAASMGAEVFELGSYDVAASMLAPGDTVLDVGAHFGFVPLRLADLVGPLRVVACEPAPPTFACLEANLRDHLEGAVARHVAVGAASGRAELTYYLDPGMSALSTLDADEADVAHNIDTVMANVGVDDATARRQAVTATMEHAATFEVPVVTVADLVAEHEIDRVDLLKIDVERAELEVLEGITDDVWRRIGAIVMEVHDVEDRRDRVAAELAGRGFDVTWPAQEGVLRGTSVHQVIARRRGPTT